jgi:hypothetical protein
MHFLCIVKVPASLTENLPYCYESVATAVLVTVSTATLLIFVYSIYFNILQTR